MNKRLLLYLYGLSIKHPVIGIIAVFVIKFSTKFFFLIFFAETIYLSYIKDIRAAYFVTICFLDFFVVSFIRALLNKKRPFEELPIKPLIPHHNGRSFPSRHTASAFIIAVMTFYFNGASSIFLILLAAAAGISRVFAGIHYPVDILAGMVISIFFSFIYPLFFILC